MTRILHTQMERQRFHLKRVEAQNNDKPITTTSPTYQDRLLSDTLTSVSSTCLLGYLEIHDGVINFLKAQEVWSDFNSPGRAGGTQ